ncbi:IS30 family transposase, partial [uncultured Fretibacterium sp.]|uniref:IS30 family transposase n=1 Tax=uncultured Fretibacterium sp. TaxID=1678694 RepID=UPI002625569B
EVSVNTIYRAVKSGRLSFEARKYLRRRGKTYKRKTRQDGRGHIKDTVSIELRPKEVEQRLDIGNWEIDTVLGKPGTGGLVTVVDRKTRLLLAAKIEDKTATTVQAALIRLLKGVECRSLTTDNGKEFARHKEVSAALGVPVYFAHPHSPWERGTNENTNGLIREYLPKGIDFRVVQSDDVLRIVERLNNRPRKCLGFRTPKEAFFNLPVAFGLTI